MSGGTAASTTNDTPVSGPRGGRSPRRVEAQIWTLDALLASAAVIVALVATRVGIAGDLTIRSSPWILGGLFALAEVLVVHVRFRDDAHTFSMAEAILTIGLLTIAPDQLLIAQAVGAGLALALHRHQPPIKLLFNSAQQTLGAAAAVLTIHLALGHADSLGPRAWLGIALATTVCSMVGTFSVLAVLRISNGTVAVRAHLGAALFGLVNSLLSASLGLIAVVMMSARPLAAILLTIPAASVFATNLAYVSQREQHQRLEFLYAATQVLASAPHLEDGLVQLLDRTRTTLRSDIASLLYLPVDSADHVLVTTAAEDADPQVMTVLTREELGEDWWYLLEAGTSATATGAPKAFFGQSLVQSLVVPLEGETRRIGLLVVARTQTSVNPLSSRDRRMLETLSTHLAITVENGRLEQSLAQLQELEGVLSYRASHDSLTDLANRALFTEMVGTRFAADPHHVGTMFIDLDDFKGINDTLGHAAGDTVLRETANRLRAVIGDRGVPARLGGDEFAVLITEDATPTGSRRLADQILESFLPTVQIDGHDVRIKATIGIALGQSAQDADGLLRNADIAMYVAKEAGKGCHRLFHTQMHDVVLHRQDLVERLEGAHDRGEIITYFQPIVDLTTGSPRGAEALVRWHHPVHGLLSPTSFIELAEETGRITDITRYVLEIACVEATSWDARLDAPSGAYVSINLSSRDFADPTLVHGVEQTLRDTGLPPHRLLLEVTESALQDESHVSRVLSRLRDAGVRVAIDDFGTGFSSLSRLRSLPFDVVKIAEPLVANAERGGRDRDFAQLMVDLARVLDVEAIAEGVETAGQASTLRQLGFNSAQGFYYSPAVASPELWNAWRSSLAGTRRPSSRDRRAPGGRRAADITLVSEHMPRANEA